MAAGKVPFMTALPTLGSAGNSIGGRAPSCLGGLRGLLKASSTEPQGSTPALAAQPDRYQHTASIEGSERSSPKADKTSLGTASNQPPITMADIIQKFKDLFGSDEAFSVVGNIANGLVIFSLADPTHYMALRGSHAIVAYLDEQGTPVFGGTADESHLEWSAAVMTTPELAGLHAELSSALANSSYTRLRDIPEHLAGAFFNGKEREFWIIDPITGDLYPIDDTPYMVEFLQGMGEITEDVDRKPPRDFIQSARASANNFAHIRKELVRRFGGRVLLVTTSTSPSGHPDNARINDRDNDGNHGAGNYVRAAALRFYESTRDPQGRDPLAQSMYNQIAQWYGYEDFESMLAAHDQLQVWNMAAGHLNEGLLNAKHRRPDGKETFVTDIDNMISLADLTFSELGAITRMLNGCGPFSFDVPVKIHGEYPLDAREFGRDLMRTAKGMTEPIRTKENLLVIRKQTMTAGKAAADRLERSGIAQTLRLTEDEYTDNFSHLPFDRDKLPRDEDGKIILHLYTAHGSGRLRDKDTGQQSLRVENTAVPAGGIRERSRAVAFQEIFQFVAKMAYDEHKHVFDYIQEKTGLSEQEIWGGADALVKDYFLHGTRSKKFKTYIEKMYRFLEIIDLKKYPVMRKSVMAAYATLESMQVVAGNFDAFANAGLGPLGGPAREMAQAGMSGLDFARITHKWQEWEEELLDLPDDTQDDLVESFLNGGWLPFTETETKDLARSLKKALKRYLLSINIKQKAALYLDDDGAYVPSQRLSSQMTEEQKKQAKDLLDTALTQFLQNRQSSLPKLPHFDSVEIDNQILGGKLWGKYKRGAGR